MALHPQANRSRGYPPTTQVRLSKVKNIVKVGVTILWPALVRM